MTSLISTDPVHSAGQFSFRSKSHAFHQRRHPVLQVGSTCDFIDQKRLADDLHHREAGIQGRKRILKNHLHVSPNLPHLFRVQLIDPRRFSVISAQVNFTAGRLVSAHNGSGQGTLPAPAFAYQSERFPFLEREAYAVDCPHLPHGTLEYPFLNWKELFEVLYLEQGRCVVRLVHFYCFLS